MAGAAGKLLISIRWTTSAVDDLKIISSHIELQRDLATANRVCRNIYDSIQILRRFPLSGRDLIEENTRELVVPRLPYVVAYRVIGSGSVEILRIWHGAQERSE